MPGVPKSGPTPTGGAPAAAAATGWTSTTNLATQRACQHLYNSTEPSSPTNLSLKIVAAKDETFSTPDSEIDDIIKNRRDQHASSFGYKFLKDTMSNTDNPAIWGACLIPRLLIGPIYMLGKWAPFSGLGVLVNPLFMIRGILGLIARNLSISEKDRKEQYLRTQVEGTEDVPDRAQGDLEYYASTYDQYKQYKGGVLGEIKKHEGHPRPDVGMSPTPVTSLGSEKPTFLNLSEDDKTQLLKDLNEIYDSIVTQLGKEAKGKSWMKKLKAKIDEIRNLPPSS